MRPCWAMGLCRLVTPPDISFSQWWRDARWFLLRTAGGTSIPIAIVSRWWDVLCRAELLLKIITPYLNLLYRFVCMVQRVVPWSQICKEVCTHYRCTIASYWSCPAILAQVLGNI